MSTVRIYTDGACRGNPGPGGWAAILQWLGDAPEEQAKVLAEKTLSGAERHTTNNRMELMAAIAGLKALRRRSAVLLTTDSEYTRQGITRWIADWKRRNWKRSNRAPVRNRDLWQCLDALNARHQVRWHWVKGHSGHPGNEAADCAANAAIDELLRREA